MSGGHAALFEAVAALDPEAVRRQLARGAETGVWGGVGIAALHYAVTAASNLGREVEAGERGRPTPGPQALTSTEVGARALQIVGVLATHDPAGVDVLDDTGETPLMHAAYKLRGEARRALVGRLLVAGGDPNRRDKHGMNLDLYGAEAGDPIYALLDAYGWDVSALRYNVACTDQRPTSWRDWDIFRDGLPPVRFCQALVVGQYEPRALVWLTGNERAEAESRIRERSPRLRLDPLPLRDGPPAAG